MIAKTVIAQVVEKQLASLDERPSGQSRRLLGNMPYLADQAILLGGIRGAGRSTLLLQLMRSEYPQAWYTDFEDPRLVGFEAADFSRLRALIRESGRGVVLLDKVDGGQEWPAFVADLLDSGIKVVATVSLDTLLAVDAARAGAAAGQKEREALRQKLPGRRPSARAASGRALSVTGSGLRTKRSRFDGEALESLCDRLITMRVDPFSYPEFLEATHKRGGETSIQDYMQRGGFPELLKSTRSETLYGVYEKIVSRDVLLAKGVRDRTALLRIALQLFSSNGEGVTANMLRKELKIKAVSTVTEHMEHLERAGLFSYLPLWSDNPARQYVNPRRVYAADTALCSALTLKKTPDHEKMLATLIHNHLRSRYEALFYLDGEERCDFVAVREGRPTLCVQVCYEGEDPDTLQERAEALIRARALTGAPRSVIVTLESAGRVTVGEHEVETVDADAFLSE